MDFRFIDSIHKFAESEGLKDNYDYVALAGSAKNLVENGEESIILKQIEISSRLHGIKKVYLIHHEDCGAYGGKKAFSSDEEEFGKHKADLETAKGLITNRFSQLEVIKVIAHLKEEAGKNIINFEKID